MTFAFKTVLKIKNRLTASPRLMKWADAARSSIIYSTAQQHEIMLSDQVRVDAYHRAIEKQVSEGDVVIDLGTGTGILSYFASKQRPRRIFAIDHSDFIGRAEELARQNGVTNIEFIKVNSKDFKPPEKVDVILHEQIGDTLFNENMVENIAELRDRVLKDGGKIIPARFELYLEPVKMKDEYHIPFIWEVDHHGFRVDSLKYLVDESEKQFAVMPCQVDYLLCEPEPVMSVDLETQNEGDLPSSLQFTKTVKQDGRMDGVCLFFEIIFDDEISLSTSPKSTNTHWQIFVFRLESENYRKGDKLRFDWQTENIGEPLSWSFHHEKV